MKISISLSEYQTLSLTAAAHSRNVKIIYKAAFNISPHLNNLLENNNPL